MDTDPRTDPTKAHPRAAVLDHAKAAVLSDRNRDYGDPEDNFADIAKLWNAYCDMASHSEKDFNSVDVANMMILVKMARSIKSPTVQDHWTDMAGYAACGYSAALALAFGKQPQ